MQVYNRTTYADVTGIATAKGIETTVYAHPANQLAWNQAPSPYQECEWGRCMPCPAAPQQRHSTM